MKIWRTLRRVAGTVCFLGGLVVLLALLTHVTRNKNEAGIVYPYYYEPENSLDVVFVGSSHVMCGIYPLELYHDFGILSYDYASSALVLPQSYYQVIEAVKTQTPGVMVVDVAGAMYENTKVGSREYVHTQLDNMKWSRNKVRAIQDLIEDPADRAEYYFPLIRFHTRWKELEDGDWWRISGLTKGAYLSDGVMEDAQWGEIVPPEYTVPMSEYAESYLRKILDFCRERGQEVVLLNTPMRIDTETQGKCNAVRAVAEEYGVPYLNLMDCLEEMDFDWDADMRNYDHCNISGARKVTAYVGTWLKAHYELPDHRGDGGWDAAYAAYQEAFPD